MKTGRPPSNLAGQRFGRLVAQKIVHATGSGAMWLCLCDCGKTSTVRAQKLKSGHTKSCGCRRHKPSKAKGWKRARAVPEPVVIEHREKTWRGAEDATAKLTALWGVQ